MKTYTVTLQLSFQDEKEALETEIALRKTIESYVMERPIKTYTTEIMGEWSRQITLDGKPRYF